MKKFTIWSSDINLDDWRDDLLEEHPEADEYELYRLAEEINDDYLEAERYNLRNIALDDPILVIADLGLWHGRASGYRNLATWTVGDCLYSNVDGMSSPEWYVDELGDLRCREAHHDGVNYYTYRVWKHNASEQQRENLLDKLYEGTATRRDITRVTERLGDKIARYYGIETGSKRYAIAKEKARQQAIEWQIDYALANEGMSYSELADAGKHFRKLGKRFGLLREFRENAII